MTDELISREQAVQVVQAARMGEADTDLRSLIACLRALPTIPVNGAGGAPQKFPDDKLPCCGADAENVHYNYKRALIHCGQCETVYAPAPSAGGRSELPACKHCGGPCVLSVTQVAATATMNTRDDAERFLKQYSHSAQWENEKLMITFEQEELIAALIGDVPATTPSARAAAEELFKYAKELRHDPTVGLSLVKIETILARHCADSAAAMKGELVDEVQRRMDAVVEAAVEEHSADADWPEAADKLSAAIESLLELRDKPVP